MSLLIRQGKQDTSNDTFQREPFEEKDVVVVIEKLELNKYLPGNLNVSLRVMTGAHTKMLYTDLVTYDSSNANSWKYRALRRCAGEPYDPKEPEQIDIEALLKDKILLVDFTIFTKKDGTKKQDVVYKKVTKEALNLAFPKVESEELEDLPYEDSKEEASPTIEPQTQVSLAQDNDDAEWE